MYKNIISTVPPRFSSSLTLFYASTLVRETEVEITRSIVHCNCGRCNRYHYNIFLDSIVTCDCENVLEGVCACVCVCIGDSSDCYMR